MPIEALQTQGNENLISITERNLSCKRLSVLLRINIKWTVTIRNISNWTETALETNLMILLGV
jgi:hypothetical protein